MDARQKYSGHVRIGIRSNSFLVAPLPEEQHDFLASLEPFQDSTNAGHILSSLLTARTFSAALF